MRAVIVYESMYGNTHHIADAIGAGLRSAFEVDVVPLREADAVLAGGADLIVVGGPTHAHGLSRTSTRRSAMEAAAKPDTPLVVDSDADPEGPGLREWLDTVDGIGRKAAAFDTRMDMPPIISGRAAKAIDKRLRRAGFDEIASPESFLVTTATELEPDELERATEWGRQLAGRMAGVEVES